MSVGLDRLATERLNSVSQTDCLHPWHRRRTEAFDHIVERDVALADAGSRLHVAVFQCLRVNDRSIPFEEAIEIANDTVYGLAAYIQSGSLETARTVARQLRAGSVYVNGPAWDLFAPFGGYKQSGNGREYADWGIHDFTEVKGVCGWS